MKITLRKRDSVISAVLFVFNVYKDYKNDYSIRLGDLLKIMMLFDKSEASIRTALSRMVKSGILINQREEGDTVYTLSADGIENLDAWNKGLARFFSRHKQRNADWDAQWHMLTIIGFSKSDYDNQDIVDEIKECGLREINSNVWATPYPIDEDVLALLEQRGFKYLRMTGSIESNTDFTALLKDVYELAVISEKYNAFLQTIIRTEDKMPTLKAGDHFSVLFDLGWDFYDIVTADPALPAALVKNCDCDKAVQKMGAVRPLLQGEIMRYFKQNNM